MKKAFNKINVLNKIAFCMLVASICSFGCEKLVSVDSPNNRVTASSAFDNDATAAAVLTGIYTNISQASYSGVGFFPNLTCFAGLSSDEFTLWNGINSSSSLWNKKQIYFYNNSLYSTATESVGGEFWTNFYAYIFTCNSAIEGLTNSTSLLPSVKQQLLGEAKFMRALFYFYLVNLYGDVPLVLTTDYKVNSSIKRVSKEMVYQQVISDLNESKSLLSDNYLDASVQKMTAERLRPTRWAASSLLARTYLFTKDWNNAEAEASSVINNKSLYDTVSLNNVFLKNSKEAIWQLQPVNNGWNTEDARLFIFPTSAGPTINNPIYLSNYLLNEFETADKRKNSWTKSLAVGSAIYYYPYKYKVATQNAGVSEYLMVFRLAEQYLIRSEARAQQGNLVDAIADLNLIRTRAGLSNTTAVTKNDILSGILHERKVELFAELGHRWLDLKRSGTIDSVMAAVTLQKSNGTVWKSFEQLYPLPYSDLLFNQSLVQNDGY